MRNPQLEFYVKPEEINHHYIVDDVQLREPNLLLSQQPKGPVQVDLEHPLGKICSFAWIGSEPEHDLASGNAGYPYSIGTVNTRKASQYGLLAETTAQDNGFGILPNNRLYDTTKKLTMVWFGSINVSASTNYADLIGVSYNENSWSTPWVSLTFQAKPNKSGGTTRMNYDIAVGGVLKEATSNTGLLDDNTYRQYTCVIDTTQATTTNRGLFYKDGLFYSGIDTAISPTSIPAQNSNIDWGDKDQVNLFQVYSGGTGVDSLVGTCVYAYIFDTTLSAEEIKSIYDDPYQFLVPK